MRVLVCDDDAHVRSVIRALAQQHGLEVVGEAEDALGAIELIGRLAPDAVVVDLALRSGSGTEVVTVARGQGCRVVIFSAYLDQFTRTDFPDAVQISKPEFQSLEAAFDALAARRDGGEWTPLQPDRRRGVPAGQRGLPSNPVESTSEFYKALAGAWSGDALVSLEPSDPGDVEALTPALRAVIRAQDRMTRSGERVLLLLVGGGPAAVTAVVERLARAVPHLSWSYRFVTVEAGEAGADAFARLRTVNDACAPGDRS